MPARPTGAELMRFRAARDKAQGGYRIGVGVAPDDQLRHQGRVGQQEGEEQVDQQEGGTAVAGGLGRETPDIAETDGAAGGGHDKPEAGAEFTPWCCHLYYSVVIGGDSNRSGGVSRSPCSGALTGIAGRARSTVAIAAWYDAARSPSSRPGGEIGRHRRLKISRPSRPCRFKSGPGHQSPAAVAKCVCRRARRSHSHWRRAVLSCPRRQPSPTCPCS